MTCVAPPSRACAKPARYAGPSPLRSLRCSTSTVPSSAARRSAIAPVPSGELSSTTRIRWPSGAAPASTASAARRNASIAALFDELADLYELDGAIVHRVVAYRTAAKAVRESPVSIAALTREGRVTEVPGIGKTLEEKIQSLLDTGTIPAAEKLRAKFPT